VVALVMAEPAASAALDAVAAQLGVAGADRVLVCEGAGLGRPALDATHGGALLNVADRLPPIIVLFPAGGPGDELGPPLAARLGGAFGRAVDVELSDEPGPLADGVGRVRLCRWRGDRTGYRRMDPVDIERPVIAILGAGGAAGGTGGADVDVEVIPWTAPPGWDDTPIVELGAEPDAEAAVPLARALVVVGPAAGPAAAARLRAAAPAGVVVVESGDDPPVSLAAASPELLIAVGAGAEAVAISPRTRVAAVGAAPLPADVAWRPARADAWDELAAALATLRLDGGGA
jgi:hypothetical protein